MKKAYLFLLTCVLLVSPGVAQDAISYQAIARSNAGAILPNQTISVKFEIRQGSMTGTTVFSETHTTTTNQFGLFTIAIGSVNTTQFQAINWPGMPFFMEVSIDPAGGSSYTSVGNQQLMSVPYALYARTAGNAGITPTISINLPNTVTSSAGSYSINVPAGTTYSAGTGIAISGGVISNTAAASNPTISINSPNTVTSSAGSYTINVPAASSYSAGTGIAISGGVISNTATAVLTYTAGGNQLSVTQGTSVSTVTLSVGNVNGIGTAGVLPMWGSVNTLSNSPVTTFTATGGVAINPSLVGSGSPAQSLQVYGPSSGSTYVAHFLQGSAVNTGIGISTQPSGGHAIGTLNTQDLGFFTANTNVVSNYPFVLKTSGRVGIGNTNPAYLLDVNGGINTSQFYNMNGLAAAPPTSNGGEGKLYFSSASNRLMMSENGGAWVPVANTLWTKGTGILYNSTLTDNVGIGTNVPGNTLDVLSNANVSALRAKNSGTGNGIEGTTTSATSAAILGYNDGPGPSIAGSKSISASSGNAGRFEIFSSANTSDALVAVTPGSGAALHATNSSSNAMASNLAVLMEDGHLKAKFTNAITNSDVSPGPNSLGTMTYAVSSNVDQSNDVRGAISMSGSFVMLPGNSKSVTFTVAFKKTYRNPPVIILTPNVPASFPDNLVVTTQVLNTANTDFTFRLSLNYFGTGANLNFTNLTVNYFVLE